MVSFCYLFFVSAYCHFIGFICTCLSKNKLNTKRKTFKAAVKHSNVKSVWGCSVNVFNMVDRKAHFYQSRSQRQLYYSILCLFLLCWINLRETNVCTKTKSRKSRKILCRWQLKCETKWILFIEKRPMNRDERIYAHWKKMKKR